MAERRALLRGTGISVAKNKVDNTMLARILDTNDQWVQERSGIVTRYYVDAGTGSSDLGAEAARQALDQAGVDAADVDYLVCATMTPDHYFPGAGTLIQHKLGL
ncbi:MAG: 3-oxoacyl-ACP synthase, partial [Acidobacteriota bacterium]